VLWPKIGHVGPTCQAGRPCNLAGRSSFLPAPPLGIGYLEHRLWWTRRQNTFLKCAITWQVGQGDVAGQPHLGSVELVLCATSFPHVILSVTMPYFGHNEDMHGFSSIWCFSLIECSRNGRSIKLMELISNMHLCSISWMKCRYVSSKAMHFMTANNVVNMSVNELSNSEWLQPLQLLWRIDGDVIIVHDLITTGLCRTVAQLCGPVPRRHKGQRPQQVEQHVVNSENRCFSDELDDNTCFNAFFILYKYSWNKHGKRT
jgi:hypothetical protein